MAHTAAAAGVLAHARRPRGGLYEAGATVAARSRAKAVSSEQLPTHAEVPAGVPERSPCPPAHCHSAAPGEPALLERPVDVVGPAGPALLDLTSYTAVRHSTKPDSTFFISINTLFLKNYALPHLLMFLEEISKILFLGESQLVI